MPELLYTTASFRGLGRVTEREIAARLGVRAIARAVVRDADLLRVPYSGPPADFAKLSTTEDVFGHLGEAHLTGTRDDEGAVAEALSEAPIEAAVVARSAYAPRKGRGAPTYRVIVRAEDASWRRYRRERLHDAATAAIRSRHRRWVPVPDDAELEFWVQIAGKTAVLGLRLSDRTMRHRDYKASNIPGSLRPTVAAALVFLSRPDPGDVFLDPMCGAGTILIERALAGRYRLLVGGDRSEEAVSVARGNFGPRHKPWDLRVWDVAALPLDSASVSCLVTNPPWGRQIGSSTDTARLYAALLSEGARVLVPGGRGVFLTSEWDAMKAALDAAGFETVEHLRDIHVKGRRADAFVTTWHR